MCPQLRRYDSRRNHRNARVCFLEELKNLRAGGEGGGKGEDAHKCWRRKLRLWCLFVSHFQADFSGPALCELCACSCSSPCRMMPFHHRPPWACAECVLVRVFPWVWRGLSFRLLLGQVRLLICRLRWNHYSDLYEITTAGMCVAVCVLH